MRKAFVILVLVSVFFSEVGYIFYYGYQQSNIKAAVKKQVIAGIDDRSLQIIELDKNKDAIVWEKEGKEFYLGGQMFDVVRISKLAGKTYLHCLNDKKEALLKKKINALAQQSSSRPASEKNKHVLKLILSDCILVNMGSYQVHTGAPQLTFARFTESPLFSAAEIILPPPRA